MNRDFKGIWIPREVWLDRRISMGAKVLLAEIWSLHDREKGGCFASNEYLCEFMDIKISALKELLKQLRDKGFLVDVSFDGRNRIFRAQLPDIDYGGQQPPQSGGRQTAGKPAGRQPVFRPADSRFSGPPSDYIDISLEQRREIPPLSPIGGKSSSSRKKQIAKKLPEKTEPQKTKFRDNIELTEDEHTKLLSIHGEPKLKEMLDILHAFKGSSGKRYKSDYHVLLAGGWVNAEYAKRKNAPTDARKNRRYAPSSDNEAAANSIAEMRARAI